MPIGSATIVLGFIMNLFHGLVAGIYLSILSAFVAPNHCGFVFGTAYAIGSVGSYLLSIIGKGNFLCNPFILILYACFVLVIITHIFYAVGLGAGLGMALENNIVVLVLTSSTLFIVNVILFFYFYEIYYKNASAGQHETIRIDSLINQYGLTAREKEVLILILKGNANSSHLTSHHSSN